MLPKIQANKRNARRNISTRGRIFSKDWKPRKPNLPRIGKSRPALFHASELSRQVFPSLGKLMAWTLWTVCLSMLSIQSTPSIIRGRVRHNAASKPALAPPPPLS